jgi:tripartite-type tricarboxylate transporter receptor subunit TctC
MGQWLSERFGRQVLIENRTGAGSNLAAELVVKAPPDGYTLLMMSSVNTINATLYDNLSFNFITDIAPVASIYRNSPSVVVVNPSFPAKTLPEFIAYAKANPGRINMASSGAAAYPIFTANCSREWRVSTCSMCHTAVSHRRLPIC